MEHLLVAFAVWGLWTVLTEMMEASPWFWRALPFVLGVGGQCLIDYHDWWLGLGLGGLAMILMRFSDLLLVTTDWVRVLVLRQQRATRQ
jgi:hypothetical protein